MIVPYNTTVNDISASNFNSTSDIRLKTNIQPIGDPIGKVKQIEGVSFNWKKDNKPALGVIADQVQEDTYQNLFMVMILRRLIIMD